MDENLDKFAEGPVGQGIAIFGMSAIANSGFAVRFCYLDFSISYQLSSSSKQLRWEDVAEFLDGVGLVAVGDENGVAGLDDDEVVHT